MQLIKLVPRTAPDAGSVLVSFGILFLLVVAVHLCMAYHSIHHNIIVIINLKASL